MRRQDRYPETQTFHYYNANPRNRITGDCAFRAISTALNQDYNTTVMEMAAMMCETGYSLNDGKGIDNYLKSKGWIKCPQPKKWDNTKYTGDEFCRHLTPKEKKSNMVIIIGHHHITSVISGKIYDIWDCTRGCVGNYWIKG